MKAIGVTAGLALACLIGGCATMGGPEPQARGQKPSAATISLLGVTVQGADYPTLFGFKGRLQTLPGVQRLYHQSFNAQERSLLQVEYAGNAQGLADAIQALSSKEKPLYVLRFDPAQIDVQLGVR